MLQTAVVGIGCKIGCDQFPYEPWFNKETDTLKPVNGDEIIKFLLDDCGYCHVEETDTVLEGDKNIWYLCRNEKFGALTISDNFTSKWSFGEAHSDRVRSFVEELKTRNIISNLHYMILMNECQFAQDHFDIHYDIRDYLLAIKDGKEWVKPEGGMLEARAFFARSFEMLEDHFGEDVTINVPNV